MKLTSVWVRVLNTLELPLGFLEESSQLPRVANVAVTLKLDADLDSAVSPDVSANAPVERVFQVATVERLDVRLVGLRKCGCGGSSRAGRGGRHGVA